MPAAIVCVIVTTCGGGQVTEEITELCAAGAEEITVEVWLKKGGGDAIV